MVLSFILFCSPFVEVKCQRKKVSFNDTVNVVLIPTRSEFVQAGVSSEIWWCCSDLLLFKDDATQEIQNYASAQNIHIYTAIVQLYQPQPLIEA